MSKKHFSARHFILALEILVVGLIVAAVLLFVLALFLPVIKSQTDSSFAEGLFNWLFGPQSLFNGFYTSFEGFIDKYVIGISS